MTLNIDPGISGPRRSVDPVAGAPLPGLSKKVVANLAQVVETYPFGVSLHIGENVLNGCHQRIVSLLILKSTCELRNPGDVS